MSPAIEKARPRGDFCPVCERFIGPQDECPYCGEDSAKSGLLKGLRHASLILAFLGLALLYFAAAHREIPATQIADITPMMNFAHVRVAGKVGRKPYISKRHGKVDYLSFLVEDRTGELRVAAYRDVARELVGSGRVPEKDTWVDVAGTLSVSANGQTKLRLYTVDQLRITGIEDNE